MSRAATGPGRLSALGFDQSRVLFGLRTALGSWLALLVATHLQLDSPHWAAMTVWVVSQPSRGMLVERAVQRAAGTIVGSAVGMALILMFAGKPAILVAGLALWCGLCAFVGNVLRQYRAYGVFLAGFTAALVALVDFPHPDHIPHLALMRVATILVGIAVATGISALFARKPSQTILVNRARRVAANTLRWAAQSLAGASPAQLAAGERELVAEMAAIEDVLDQQAAGSPAGHRRARGIRNLLGALLTLLAGARTVSARRDRGGKPIDRHQWLLAARLGEAAFALDTAAPVEPVLAGTPTGANGPAEIEVLSSAFAGLAETLETITPDGAPAESRRGNFAFHRDWIGARAAMLRAAAAIAAVGILWLGSGWQAGQFMLLSTCVMTTVFSAFENPVMMLRQVLVGQTVGAALAVVFRLYLLPEASDLPWAMLLMLPFLLAGGLAIAHRRTPVAGLDYCMAFLLLAQPGRAAAAAPGIFDSAAALVLGVAIALLAFRYVLPVSSRRQLHRLVRVTVGELEWLARTQREPPEERWRARLHHRILRLVKWVEASGDASLAPVDGGVAVLTVGTAILRLKGLHTTQGLSARCRRRIEVTLRRLSEISRRPDAAAAALERTAANLAVESFPPWAEADSLHDAAAALRANRVFFAGGHIEHE